MPEASPVLLEEAYLLHRRNYRETSFLLEFLTRSYGRVRLIGKGTRRQKGALVAVVWPFVPLRISWSGRGELPVMRCAERLRARPIGDPKGLACGLYLNELIVHLTALRDPHPGVFNVYDDTLRKLSTGNDYEIALRVFELRFLEEIGYALILDNEIETGLPVDPEKFYVYLTEQGPIESGRGPASVRGSTLLGLRNGVLATSSQRTEAKGLMRRVIAHHLGDRPLKSRELLRYSAFS
jgi:DNA repair protein RecO (recombination protein O)